MIGTIITVIYTALLTLAILAGVVILIKNINAFKNQIIISDAICRYGCELIQRGEYNILNLPVTYDDMEDYDRTLWRLWDWGYKRILPPEKFELIKPYIKK